MMRPSSDSFESSSIQSSDIDKVVVVFWPKHGLRSNLSVSNFPGGHASRSLQPVHTYAYAHPSPQWLYHSKIAGSGPELYTPCDLSVTANCISREFFLVVV